MHKMIKVYIDNEWVLTFENQEQLNTWWQSVAVEYVNEPQFIEIVYENAEEQ